MLKGQRTTRLIEETYLVTIKSEKHIQKLKKHICIDTYLVSTGIDIYSLTVEAFQVTVVKYSVASKHIK